MYYYEIDGSYIMSSAPIEDLTPITKEEYEAFVAEQSIYIEEADIPTEE